MKKIIISDCTLRDGNHAIKHSISLEAIEKYCLYADKANIPIIEVGHGIGLGASSLLIGKSRHTDKEILETARKNLKNSKLGVHVVPGVATVEKDIKPAIDLGVDVFRIASHCTEATVTKTHIEFLRKQNKTVYGVLMMTALVDENILLSEAKKMEDYGAQTIMLMDSTGTYLPNDTQIKISKLVSGLNIPVGFHAHNNLGLSVANSLTAVENGASIIDVCMRGFGAGAGNTPLEIIVPVFKQSGYDSGINFELTIQEADKIMDYLIKTPINIKPIHILTGINKILAAFEKPIIEISNMNNISYYSLINELGNKKLVAGQEDLILEIAQKLKK